MPVKGSSWAGHGECSGSVGSAQGGPFLLSGRMGKCETPVNCREQGKESTWISLLPLIAAENKTEIQQERKEPVSH